MVIFSNRLPPGFGDYSHIPLRCLPAAKVRQEFSCLVEEVARGRVRLVVTRWGKPMAAIMPLEDLTSRSRLEKPVPREGETTAQLTVRCAHESLERRLEHRAAGTPRQRLRSTLRGC